MSPGNVARVVAVLAAVVAAAGSATSSSNNPPPPPHGQNANQSPPPPQHMEPSASLGLWRSTFGAVKIEADNSKGGISSGAVQGVWVYQRQGQEVIGYFAGNLRGNVLEFRWQEPNNPPLTGAGYLVFDQQGRQYTGRWWSDRKDRLGDWNGWRQAPNQRSTEPSQDAYGGQGYADPYGGQSYGQPSPYGQPQQPPYGQPQQPPYGQPQQPSPYGQPYGQPQQPPYGQPTPPRGYY